MAKAALFSMLLATAFAATSCSDNNTDSGQSSGDLGELREVTLTASVGDQEESTTTESKATTRVGMLFGEKDSVKFYWHNGDQILVQTKTNSYPPSYLNSRTFTTTDPDGSLTASFTGQVESSLDVNTYALSPYNPKHKFDGTNENIFTYNLPDTYTYTTVDSLVSPTVANGKMVFPANRCNMPMLGMRNPKYNTLNFFHIGADMLIRIDKMPAAEGTLTVSADQKLSGDFTCNNTLRNGVLVNTDTPKDGENKVTFKFSGATKGAPGIFYLPMATGTYTNVSIAIDCGDVKQTIPYGTYRNTIEMKNGIVDAILLYYKDGQVSRYTTTTDGKYLINGRKFVDLGLPSKTLWAEYNVGANSVTDLGNIYAYGEVTGYVEATDFGDGKVKTEYTWANYKWATDGGNTVTKYNVRSDLYVLEPDDDAATVNWGNDCRMPTREEIDELNNESYCSWETTRIDGVRGVKVTSKLRGFEDRYIFLPYAGHRTPDGFSDKDGYYWSSSHDLNNDRNAYSLTISTNFHEAGHYPDNACHGGSVRAVAKPQ